MVIHLFKWSIVEESAWDGGAGFSMQELGTAQVCQPLLEILDQFSLEYDRIWYTALGHQVVGCPETLSTTSQSLQTRVNPFFPSVAVLMFNMLARPGNCIIGSCEKEKKSFKEGKQDCGTKSNFQYPWFGGPTASGKLDWDRMICDDPALYLPEFLPDVSSVTLGSPVMIVPRGESAPSHPGIFASDRKGHCAVRALTSVDAIKRCLLAAESSGVLGYCQTSERRPELHRYYLAAMHIMWHRTTAQTGVPPSQAILMGFSFGKGRNCPTISTCTTPGKTNEILGSAAVAYYLQQNVAGARGDASCVKLALQYEVAVAAKNSLEAKTRKFYTWNFIDDEEGSEGGIGGASIPTQNKNLASSSENERGRRVMQLVEHDTEKPNLCRAAEYGTVRKLEIFALGGLKKGEYLNTQQVYEIASGIAGKGHSSPLIALAHPDHYPRVYRTISEAGANMDKVYGPISPFSIATWYEDQDSSSIGTATRQSYNLFKVDPSVWSRLVEEVSDGSKGMFSDSLQPWTRDALTFSVSEFWVYPLQMAPGRNDVGSLPVDPVQLPICTVDDSVAVWFLPALTILWLLSVGGLLSPLLRWFGFSSRRKA